LARPGYRLTAIGLLPDAPFSERLKGVDWIPTKISARPARIWIGREQHRVDREFGRTTLDHVRRASPVRCYGFTQVSLESAAWSKEQGIDFFLDNPNGDIRNVRAVYESESWHWCSVPFLGHPTSAMVHRVEQEYALATRIRVSSEFARKTMIARGVPAAKVDVIPQFLDLAKYRKPSGLEWLQPTGPLRVCFVGSLDLRKGFVYLLRAIRKVGPERVTLRIVGNTGDPWCRRLFERESRGLDVRLEPGDPLPAYRWAELCIMPSLEDGFGFVVPEAMASGIPVIATDQCGAAEWLRHGENGWVVPFATRERRVDALADRLEFALAHRASLRDMGAAALDSVSNLAKETNSRLLAGLFYGRGGVQ
jgi:glycosyltransferase involved in cell wall biosynthesis